MDELLAVFVESSREHLRNMENAILDLEEGGDCLSLLNAIFRAAHTIKGDAKTVGLTEIELYVHKFEDRVEALRSRGKPPSAQEIRNMLAGFDRLTELVESL